MLIILECVDRRKPSGNEIQKQMEQSLKLFWTARTNLAQWNFNPSSALALLSTPIIRCNSYVLLLKNLNYMRMHLVNYMQLGPWLLHPHVP